MDLTDNELLQQIYTELQTVKSMLHASCERGPGALAPKGQSPEEVKRMDDIDPRIDQFIGQRNCGVILGAPINNSSRLAWARHAPPIGDEEFAKLRKQIFHDTVPSPGKADPKTARAMYWLKIAGYYQFDESSMCYRKIKQYPSR